MWQIRYNGSPVGFGFTLTQSYGATNLITAVVQQKGMFNPCLCFFPDKYPPLEAAVNPTEGKLEASNLIAPRLNSTGRRAQQNCGKDDCSIGSQTDTLKE